MINFSSVSVDSMYEKLVYLADNPSDIPPPLDPALYALIKKYGAARSAAGNALQEGSHENYADWTDEKRSRVYRNMKRRANYAEKKRLDKINKRDALIAEVKKKLTEKEFEAIFDSGYAKGRGYEC